MTRLVADIGGTNTRMGLVQGGELQDGSIRSFRNDDFGGVEDVIKAYAPPQVDELVIAIAGTVLPDRGRVTNRDWVIDAAKTGALVGAADVALINDLAALGYSVPHLTPSQLQALDQGKPRGHQQLVVGLATGFNVSPVSAFHGNISCTEAETGHIPLSHDIETALGFRDHSFTSVEELFSGRGLSAFCALETGDPDMTGIKATTDYQTNPKARAAIDQYAHLFGMLLHELTMAYMPTGGIALAGSVARAVMTEASAPCIKALRQPFKLELAPTPPLSLITDDIAPLYGCATYLI